MKYIRNIVISNTEPPINNVAWLKPLSNGSFELSFFGSNGWTTFSATGVPEDLANDVIKLMHKVFPLETTVNISPTTLQEKGTSTEITITWNAKIEGEIVAPESVFVNGIDVTGQTSYKETISDSKTFNVEITAEGRITSVNKSITYVYPIFTGFNSATEFTENLTESLTKVA